MIKKTVTTKAPASKTSTSRSKKSEPTIKEAVINNVNLLSQIKIDIKHKNEIQKKLTQAIKTSDVTICTGPAGTGKAQPLDSLILTPNGWVTMGDIKLGDYVIGVNGLPIKVDGVYPQGIKDIYLITFSDGTTTECCGEHLWLTHTYEERNKRKRITDDNGKRITIGKEYSKGSVKNTIDIMNSLIVGKKSQKVNHSIPIVKPIKFNNKEVEVNPYLLGCLLGDGSFTNSSIQFTTNDIEIVDIIKDVLPNNHIIKEKCHQGYTIKSIGVKKNKITEYLRKVNLYGLTSSDKFIPEEYLINDIDTRLEILRGLLDTDGSVDKKTGTPIFYSTSKQLIKDVTFIVQSLGGIVKKTQKIGKYKKLNGELKECKVIYNLHINLPNGIIPFKLNRKIILLKERVKYTPIRYIKNVEFIGNKEAQCISVNDKEHLYLTNDCIVTHNTMLSVAEALLLLKNNPDKYHHIKLVKSITELKGESIGTLPGDANEKMTHIMMSFFDAFYKLIGEELTNKLLEAGYIKMEVFAAIRGRSFSNCIILVDEFQNITHDNAKTLLTRFSDDTKLVILGDVGQIDIKNKNESSLGRLIEKVKKNPMDGVNSVEFSENEIVRHRLTSYFINLFKDEPIKKVKPVVNKNRVKEFIDSIKAKFTL